MLSPRAADVVISGITARAARDNTFYATRGNPPEVVVYFDTDSLMTGDTPDRVMSLASRTTVLGVGKAGRLYVSQSTGVHIYDNSSTTPTLVATLPAEAGAGFPFGPPDLLLVE